MSIHLVKKIESFLFGKISQLGKWYNLGIKKDRLEVNQVGLGPMCTSRRGVRARKEE
jgi:hypothetical protein